MSSVKLGSLLPTEIYQPLPEIINAALVTLETELDHNRISTSFINTKKSHHQYHKYKQPFIDCYWSAWERERERSGLWLPHSFMVLWFVKKRESQAYLKNLTFYENYHNSPVEQMASNFFPYLIQFLGYQWQNSRNNCNFKKLKIEKRKEKVLIMSYFSLNIVILTKVSKLMKRFFPGGFKDLVISLKSRRKPINTQCWTGHITDYLPLVNGFHCFSFNDKKKNRVYPSLYNTLKNTLKKKKKNAKQLDGQYLMLRSQTILFFLS